MAWGDRKPEGNEKAQLPSGFLSPQAVSAGPVNITVQEDEFRVAIFAGWPHCTCRPENRVSNTRPVSFGAVMLTGASARPEAWGASRQLRLYVALRLPTPPDERYPKPVKITVPRY